MFFTGEINTIVLSSNDGKIIQSIDSIETYAYGMKKNLLCKKEETKYNNITKQYKKHNFDYIKKEEIKEHNPDWSEIPDHSYRILKV